MKRQPVKTHYYNLMYKLELKLMFLVVSKQRRKFVGLMSKTKQKANKLINELNETARDLNKEAAGTVNEGVTAAAGLAITSVITMEEFQQGEFPWALGDKSMYKINLNRKPYLN